MVLNACGRPLILGIAVILLSPPAVMGKTLTLPWGLERPVQYQQIIASVGDKLEFELLKDDEVVEEMDGLNSWLSCDFGTQHAAVVQSTSDFKTPRGKFVVEVDLLSPGTLYFASPLDCRGTYECDFLFGMTNCDVGVAVIVDVKGSHSSQTGDNVDIDFSDHSECFDVSSGACEAFSGGEESPPKFSYEFLLVTKERYCQMECVRSSKKCRGYQYQSESGLCSLLLEAPSSAEEVTSDTNDAVCATLKSECFGQ